MAYDAAANDRPYYLTRHGVTAYTFEAGEDKNYLIAMHYSLLKAQILLTALVDEAPSQTDTVSDAIKYLAGME